MGIIFLVKTVDTDYKHVDDYVSSGDEIGFCDLNSTIALDVFGITGTELSEYMNSLMPPQKRVYKTSAPANQWSDQEERSDAWQDGDNWKLVNKDPKYKFNFSEITIKDREDLASPIVSREDKFTILDKAVPRLGLEPENDDTISITTAVISK